MEQQQQREQGDDLEGALSQRGLTLNCLPDKGRSLFTTKHFHPGEVIISQEPYVCVPNNSSSSSSSGKICDGCFASGFKKCSACQVAWYCGPACQGLEWKLHRVECEVLSRVDKEKRKLVTPSVRLMLKLYLRRKLQLDEVIPTSAVDNYSLVEVLVSHMKDIDEKQLVLYAQMANLLNLILQWPQLNIKEVAENFSKLACNAHTICDSELRPLGTGLYPVISIINHSCLPNAVLVFEGRLAVVRAVQHIPKNSEVSISYIETAGSSMARQKSLKEQYFFTCTCPRCIKVGQFEDIRESAMLEGYTCKDQGCSGFLLRDSDDKGFKCEQCGLLRGKEEIKRLASEIRLTSEKASKAASSNNEAISIYKDVEELQMKLCHPFSVALLQTRDKLLKILMEVENWSEALSCCRLTVPVYERIYPEFHPLVGLQYYTCGKLEWLLGETEASVKSLTKAADVLRVTHGTSTPFVKELILQLDQARAEASHRLSYMNEKKTEIEMILT